MNLTGLINKNRVISLGLIILFLVAAYNIYRSQAAKLDSLKTRIREEKNKNEILSNISYLSESIDSYRKLLIMKEPSTVMSDINTLARDCDLKINSIKPLGESSSAEFVKYNFELSILSPNYDNLAKFVNRLETYQNFYAVDAFSIDSTAYNKDRELKVNLRLSTTVMLD